MKKLRKKAISNGCRPVEAWRIAACIEAKAAVATSISSSPFRAGGRR